MNKLERYNPMMDCCETVSWAEDAQERIDYLENYYTACKLERLIWDKISHSRGLHDIELDKLKAIAELLELDIKEDT